jgi:hypothetical protein
MLTFDNPARIDTSLDSRSISFENPKGERGRGGTAAHGRKGSPSRMIQPGEKIVLADIEGSGHIRHIWMTFPPSAPELMRAVWMEVFYDGRTEPSISVPCLDFFGLPHGRTAAYFSALTSVQEGRGFNAYFPMPFRKGARLELTNSGSKAINLFYQIDYTLDQVEPDEGYLHVLFHRENPTTLKKDFIIARGLRGPGRFLGAAVGIRILADGLAWYGEGEFKVYRDGDDKFPTICGTGLEDYVGSGWGMDKHTALYAGVPLHVAPPLKKNADPGEPHLPDFVSFYRWHLPDPIVFQNMITVTIQQIGAIGVMKGPQQEQQLEALEKKYQVAGDGWLVGGPQFEGTPIYAFGIAERQDDYSAAAFVYCRDAQPVPRLNITAATIDLGLRKYEKAPGTW